jgi:membrane fusion protein (multidrug efflux system)
MALVERDQEHKQVVPAKDEAPAGERPRVRPREPEDKAKEPPVDAAPAGWRARLAALRRHPFITAAVVIALAIAIIAALIWWLNARQYASTDDAFIDARTVQISPQVTGAIIDVPVTDNEAVSVGQALVKIDPRDYQAAVNQAQAQLEQAQASVVNIDAQIAAQQAKIDQAKTDVTQAQAALTFSQQQAQRAQALLKNGAGTEQNAQQTSSDLQQKQAGFTSSKANEIAAERQLAVLRAQRQSAVAQVDGARAQLEKAQVDLSRTTITASVDGRVVNLTAAVGAYAQPGQALMAVVPRKIWVTANFKETEITGMRVGQPVDIRIDAYPGRTFHGHVDSIQAGSGVAFSLLPPENATGNYVKVVQRVPVKIVFDHEPDVTLGPGMSVVPSVKVR